LPRPQKIDELQLIDHYYLKTDDLCYFFREYTPRQGFAYSETNSLIIDFKKPVDRRGRSEYFYKERAIQQIGKELAEGINTNWLEKATLIPIPPSKTKSNLLYDDRMTQVLNSLGLLVNCTCDIRELILQNQDTEPVHLNNNDRPTPDALRMIYEIDDHLINPAPTNIGLFDDVITAGSHFRAAKDLLIERFPEAKVVGIFVARRIPAP
jgi:predicted amidophosphoribosyltransferase